MEAKLEFDRLWRRWPATEHSNSARYRIVQCLVAQSPRYYYDQQTTLDAIEELQAFIDDFPDSEQREEAEQTIQELRLKIANKNFESARLYLKWDRPTAARLYLEVILSQYYDTPYADEARVAMVASYILEEDLAAAQAYLGEAGNNISDEALRREAEQFIELARNNKFDLRFYRWLYR